MKANANVAEINENMNADWRSIQWTECRRAKTFILQVFSLVWEFQTELADEVNHSQVRREAVDRRDCALAPS